jgi:phage terminase large subunit-like protein
MPNQANMRLVKDRDRDQGIPFLAPHDSLVGLWNLHIRTYDDSGPERSGLGWSCSALDFARASRVGGVWFAFAMTTMRRVVSKKWIRGPADEQAVLAGCWFDVSAGKLVCDFVEHFCRQSKGRWAGETLCLLAWERDFIMRLFGWKLPDGRRRYRSAYLEVPKKNGKSTLLSALSLALLLLDGEGGPEVDIFASDKDQAGIVYEEGQRMVQASPALAGRLEVIPSRMLIRSHDGKIRAMAADVAGSDGINPSVIIWDELHRQKTRDLWEVLEYAGIARAQFLRLMITTCGESESGPWWEQRTYSIRVNLGVVDDIHHLGVIYSADPRVQGDEATAVDGLDLDDENLWSLANPSMGQTMTVEDFRRDWAKAQETPAELANFKRLRLGIVSKIDRAFISLAAWDGCGAPILRRPGPCYLGLDLSTNDDLTALVALTGDEVEGFDVELFCWLPEDPILELQRKHKVSYLEWSRRGLVNLVPGAVIDYSYVRAAVRALVAARDVRLIVSDPYNAHKLAIELESQDGFPVKYLRQGYLSLSPPTKELLRLILSKKLRHGGNPIMRWFAGNAVEDRDAAENIKLNKGKSTGKIDGLAALVNAVAGAGSSESVEAGPSVYETRGILFV